MSSLKKHRQTAALIKKFVVTDDFIITVELVPGKESIGRSVDTVIGIAKDSFADGRIFAVSITDNPGGNPSLSLDVIGHEISKSPFRYAHLTNRK